MKFLPLILANLSRKKIRTILTIGSFAVALFLFAFLAAIKSAFNRGSEIAGADRLVINNRVSMILPLPLSYRDQIAHIPGVHAVTHYNWFGGTYKNPRNFFPQYPIDVENQPLVMPELKVPAEQWQAFARDRQGAIVGAATAKRFGWKVGDHIPIMNSSIDSKGPWEFNLDGIYHSDHVGGNETAFWFQWDYFEERVPQRVKGNVGWYVLKLEAPDDAVRVAKTIDNLFANSSFETKTETESAFAASMAKQFGNIEFLIITIGSVVFFTLLLVTGNTMAISVRERIGEIAVFKAIGFTDRSILFFILGEALALSIAGSTLGILCAAAAIPAMGAGLNGLLPRLVLSSSLMLMGMGFAIVVGIASGLLPALGAMRLRVVKALREV
ncbi:MAG TPA: FtsX-like permease family protein [Candidatus Dormibacteraeota bacterium]|jgi:putative ABC transport system permease protein|nr:FtsX-like permease family protein [Candidatus Dormibacteraeota bacterium]